MFPSVKEQLKKIRHNAIEIIPEEDFEKKLEKSRKENKPLRVKLGCDPSRPDLHIGHSVVLQKLRDFQDLGHIVILIIGDFTAMIGDPSGRNKTRPALSLEETRINGRTYFEQATKIMSEKNLEIRYNSEWLDKMNFRDVIKLASHYTVAQILQRHDFEIRMDEQTPISLHELLYPLSQAYDSVAVESDIEIGGTDQKFNFLVGRDIQQAYGQDAQCIITMELLEGIDGTEKMSKSLDNAICFTDTPREMFGKTMSIPDRLILKYFTLTTLLSTGELKELEKQLRDPGINPRNLKVRLAHELVKKYHNEDAAKNAEQEFEAIFVKKEIPDNIPEFRLRVKGKKLTSLLKETDLASSASEAARLIKQGGVYIDGDKITDDKKILDLEKEFILKVGKRKFAKVVPL